MLKIYQLVACLDEGVSYSWHFRAKSEWHVAAYIVDNYWDYPEAFRYLGLEAYSRYEDEEPLTPEILLNAIGESSIDGDSAYGFEIFEMTEEEIVSTNNEDMLPTSENTEVYSFQPTGHKNYPYKTFVPFHHLDYHDITKWVKLKWLRLKELEGYEGFEEWLSKAPEITEEESVVLAKIAEKSQHYAYGETILDKLAKFAIPMVNLAEIEGDRYSVFYDRLLEGVVGDTFLKGRVAMMIGKGYGEPTEIDFILHESSFRGTPNSADYAMIMGQMLVAMHFDKYGHKPTSMRGAYTMNRSWHTFILEKKEDNHFVLYEYDSLSLYRLEDIKKIYRFLKAFKPQNSST